MSLCWIRMEFWWGDFRTKDFYLRSLFKFPLTLWGVRRSNLSAGPLICPADGLRPTGLGPESKASNQVQVLTISFEEPSVGKYQKQKMHS